MKIPFFRLSIIDFTEIDREIAKFRALKDSYYAANRAHYGDFLAEFLNG